MTNTSDVISYYNLSDTLQYGEGATPILSTVSHINGDGPDGMINGSWDGTSDYLVTTNESVAVGRTDSLEVVVVFNVNQDLVSDESRDCVLDTEEMGTGLLNWAEASGRVPNVRDSVCRDIPINTCIPEDGGFDPPNCSNFSPAVLDNGDILFGAYDVITNYDRARYPIKVTLLNKWDGVIAEFTLEDYCDSIIWNSCEYLGQSLSFSVSNSVGVCNDGVMDLSGTPPLVMISAWQSHGNPHISTR